MADLDPERSSRIAHAPAPREGVPTGSTCTGAAVIHVAGAADRATSAPRRRCDAPGDVRRPPGWMLRARDNSALEVETPLAKQPLLLAVARRGVPGVVEASLTPAVIFVVTNACSGTRWAMLAVFVWGCVSFLWRRSRGHRLPALVIVALCGLVFRTLVGIASGSALVYFLQPVAMTIGIAGVLLVSVVIGRPIVARIAHDFCPIPPDVAGRASVVQLFAGLTVLWAVAQLLTAAATLVLLFSLDTSLFVILKPVMSLTISAGAVAITAWAALRVAHREELVFVTD